jgi:hypothetical protein
MLYYFGRLLALMLVGRMTADGAGGASHQAADLLSAITRKKHTHTHTHRHVIRTDNIEFDCSDYDAVGRDRPHSISFAPEWMEKAKREKKN